CAATASGSCVVVLGRAGDAVNVPFHPHCSATQSVFCMVDSDCRPPTCLACSPTETCTSADLTLLASDTNPLTDLARTAGTDEGTLQPVTLTFPAAICIPPVQQCGDTFPSCSGPCPTGQSCVVFGQTCVCVPPCQNATAPACNGTCPDPNQVCAPTAAGGSCVCETPCENTTSPTCGGFCPNPNQVCAPTAGG